MREIKFRAWDILNKRILNYGEIMTLPMWEVLPGTPEQRAFNVMQYTGLKDKNGKEIYEGDIVLTRTSLKFIISYKNGAFIKCWQNYNVYLLYDSLIKDGCTEAYEVIGNIYENPELLEGN